MQLSDDLRQQIKESLAGEKGSVLEHIAREHNVSVADVAACLDASEASQFDAMHFEAVMHEIAGWGKVTFIVHTDDIVLECRDVVPVGSFGRGYYNMHGQSAIGGHIKAENCQTILFVSRPFMGRESYSVQFFSKSGSAMFKVYLGRNEKKELFPDQVEKFKQFREKLASL